MGTNSAWNKNNIREVKKTFGRFMAILAITMLGVGFFSGLKVTRDSMIKTARTYINEAELFDYRLISTLGLYEEDLDDIRNVESVKVADGVYSFDFVGVREGDDAKDVYKAFSLSDTVNKPSLVFGEMPMSADECLVDANTFGENWVGKYIIVSTETDDETSAAEKLVYTKYKVTGLVNSANYLNLERGTTSLLNGSVKGFIFIPKDGFDMDYFTEIDVVLDKSVDIFTDEYDDLIDAKRDSIDEVLTKVSVRKYKELYTEAEEEIEDAESEYNEKYQEYLDGKKEAEDKLADAEAELNDAKSKIDNGERELRKSEKLLSQKEKEYNDGLKKYNQAVAEYETKKADTEAQLAAAKETIDASKADYEKYVSSIPEAFQVLYAAKLAEMKAEIDKAENEYLIQKTYAEGMLIEAEAKLEANKVLLDSGKKAIDAGKKAIKTARKELEDGKEEYKKGLLEYEEAKKDAEKEIKEAEDKLLDARTEIDDAKKELSEFELPDTYLLDRSTNVGYASYETDASIVEGISKVFPIFFFLVAALVCITTMTRMVDEQRTQIGTLKALGYSNSKIAMKYMSYSGMASLIGCVLGFLGGSKLFPWAIWQAYGVLYNYFAPIEFVIDYKLFALAIFVSLLCSVGATWFACSAELVQMPAELMRPKAPKAGKKILLERVTFIWNHMKFLHKVSIRNIFRYKKRMFMMLLGIGGCMALIITGFGVSDSISHIAADQYDNIMKFNYEISLKHAFSEAEKESFREEYTDTLKDVVFTCTESVDCFYTGGTKKINVIATNDLDITKVVNFSMDGAEVPYPEKGKVMISSAIAGYADVSVGDTINIAINDTENKDVVIGGIFENYVHHYMFMTEDTYREIFEKDCEYKNAYAYAVDTELLYETSALISKNDNVTMLSISNDIKTRVADMLKSLNYVVILVILSACSLAFVVLYNLSNINITERVREIATIKVLGFYPGETSSYVFRENLVLTIFGAIIGIPLGYFLHGFVMDNIKIDMVSFNIRIENLSYVYSFVITIVMAFLVDIILRKKIEKINMTESLKSVE